MARVAGRDVLVQLMDAVAQLQASQARQDEDIERIIVRLDLMSERTNGLAGQMASMSQQMAELSRRMDESSDRMDELAQDQLALRADFVVLAQHGRETSGGLKRLSEILVKALGNSEDRFDELEARLARLEKKTG